MGPWQLALTGVMAVVVVIVVAVTAYSRGHDAGERSMRPRFTTDEGCLFGDDLPVHETERRFVEAMPDALIVTDAAGVVNYASAGANALKLVQGNRLTADDITEVLALVVADGRVREREMKVALPRGDERRGSDGRGVRAGEEIPTDTLFLRVRIGAIADNAYAIFLRDMSDQRRFEAMRRDFMTNVSHELKTPSGAISLLAETITDAADDPDAVRYFAGRVAKESHRLTELVHKLIELQRAQDAPMLLDAKPLSVVSMVREAFAANEVQADAKHIELVLALNGQVIATQIPEGEQPENDGDTVYVRVGHEPFVTAVKNLVENAIHYSPEQTTVSVDISAVDGRVRVRVVDQGIGIPAKSVGRIFERFYRVDPARSRETGGSGLGLAITKHCVQVCGGKISVWSREGEGSTFTIELPAAEPEEERGANRTAQAPSEAS